MRVLTFGLAWSLTALLGVPAWSQSLEPMCATPREWGASREGLRLAIAALAPGPLPSTGATFCVALQNSGDSEFVVNLGIMLGNGMEPSAIRLTLTGPDGTKRELEFFGSGVVAGSLAPYLVAMGSGATYTLRVSLSDYWSLATEEVGIKLPEGSYRLSARFDGRGWPEEKQGSPASDVLSLNYWSGTVQSNVLDFHVSKDAKAR